MWCLLTYIYHEQWAGICADAETEKTRQEQEIHHHDDAMQSDFPSPARGDLAITTIASNHCDPHQRKLLFQVYLTQPLCNPQNHILLPGLRFSIRAAW